MSQIRTLDTKAIPQLKQGLLKKIKIEAIYSGHNLRTNVIQTIIHFNRLRRYLLTLKLVRHCLNSFEAGLIQDTAHDETVRKNEHYKKISL